MEHVCTLDIETIPAQSDAAWEDILDSIKPPGNIKKPESIDKWIAENLDAAAADALAKTSLNPAQGHICTIGWALDDEEPITAHAEAVEQEADVLRTFFYAFEEFRRYQLVGHFIGGFDLRFILCRAVALGVKIPAAIPRDPKPWDSHVFDTMTAWAGARGTISLSNLAQALGVGGNGDFDGSKVAEAWANGEHQKIRDYCAIDVELTREIYRKFQSVGW